jgi:hypothetical protein
MFPEFKSTYPILFWNILFISVVSTSAIASPETNGFFSIVKPDPISEIWLNPGFYTYHFENDKGLNNTNYGLGGEYRFSKASSITLGVFDNSDSQTSHYMGWYWQPLGVGPVRVGAVIGALDGYPKMLDGGWFLAVIPAASFEYRYFGANILFMPSFQDRFYGAVSLQLKFRVY